MFKKLLCKIFESKTKTLGDGLKAIKKKYHVIDEFLPGLGKRNYRCKNGRFLDISTISTKPISRIDGQRTDRLSKFTLQYGQDYPGFENEELITRIKEYKHYNHGFNVLDITTTKEGFGDIFQKFPSRIHKTYYNRPYQIYLNQIWQ